MTPVLMKYKNNKRVYDYLKIYQKYIYLFEYNMQDTRISHQYLIRKSMAKFIHFSPYELV